MRNNDWKLKIALLSTCFVAASLNAITGNIPEMAVAFPEVSLSTIELLATVPSLFQMVGIFGGKPIARKIGYKYAMLLGLLCCGVGGVIPVFVKDFAVIMAARCLFGIGCGLIMSTVLTLIVYFFDGSTRSAMIGLNGGISGMGSALTTFGAGQLLSFGWNVSFGVYFIAFPIFLLFLLIVPQVRSVAPKTTEKAESPQKDKPLGLFGLALLMFASVLLATLYVIKASTLIADSGFGTAREGSYAITFISLGSFLAGLTYGKIRAKLREKTLALFYTICGAGFVLGGLANSLAPVLIGAFLLGYGYLGFVPYIQEQVSQNYAVYGETATNVILIFQSLGAFAAPYLGSMFTLISADLGVQFLLAAGCFVMLAVGSVAVKGGKGVARDGERIRDC